MRYDGRKAARWCRDHAKDPQPFVDACTRFVSIGLAEGGLKQTEEWHLWGEEKVHQGTVLGSPTARVADRLVRYLLSNKLAEARTIYQTSTWPQPKLLKTVPGARLGDIIAYKYRGTASNYSHVSMVVNVRSSVPLVSEWGTAHNHSLTCAYCKRRWYWSQNSRASLDSIYDLVVTYLRIK
jgi:hypothetical protein